MRQDLFRALAVALSLGIAACASDPTGAGDELSDPELDDLALIVFEGVNLGVPSATPLAASGPAAVPVDYTVAVERTVQCAGGGSIGVSGLAEVNGDDETQVYAVIYDVNQQHQACRKSGLSETVFTLDSSLDYLFTLDLELGEQEQSQEVLGNVEGTIDWAAGDRSGSCPLTLDYSGMAETETESSSALANGSICGRAVSMSANVGG